MFFSVFVILVYFFIILESLGKLYALVSIVLLFWYAQKDAQYQLPDTSLIDRCFFLL